MKTLLTLVVVLGLAAGGYFFWQQQRAQQEAGLESGRAATARVEPQDISFAVTLAGEIAPAEQVSVHAHGVAKDAVPRRDSFVPRVWALHAIDEGRHLQFDRLLLAKLALSPLLRTAARLIAVPFCAMATLAVHRNEAWAARQLGVRVRLWDLLRLLRAPVSPFKQRVVALMREVALRPRAAD